MDKWLKWPTIWLLSVYCQLLEQLCVDYRFVWLLSNIGNNNNVKVEIVNVKYNYFNVFCDFWPFYCNICWSSSSSSSLNLHFYTFGDRTIISLNTDRFCLLLFYMEFSLVFLYLSLYFTFYILHFTYCNIYNQLIIHSTIKQMIFF